MCVQGGDMFKHLAVFIFSSVTIVTAQAYISASPSFVNFGQVDINSWEKSQTVHIYNWGDEDVNLTISDACPWDFDFQHYFCHSLGANQSCSMTVKFSPNSVGYKSCTAYIYSSGGGSTSIHVSGQGVDQDSPF